jgi:uncharacterized protein YceK
MRLLLAIPLMLVLSGCSKMMEIGATKPAACAVWRDVSWSAKDTRQTIVEVKVNNARRQGYCEGK